MNKIIKICPDFPKCAPEWPKRWLVTEHDMEYGEQLLEEMRPCAEFIAESNLAKKTVKRHLENLWILGGEIIREVNLFEEHSTPAYQSLRQAIGPDGGPYCRHLDSETARTSFDSTCRKLYNYLEGNKL